MILKHAILHILDQAAGQLFLSQNELDINQNQVHEYLEKLITKFNQGDFKPGQLNGDDYLAQQLDDNQQGDFVTISQGLTEKLFDVIKELSAVPGGDVLILEYTEENDDFFALFKINPAPRFVHMVDYQDECVQNQLVLNQAVLPSGSSAPDEGIIVNLMDGRYRLIEKTYRQEGQRLAYFAERFAALEPEVSIKNELQTVKQAVKQVADKFDVPLHEALATTQAMIFEDASEDGIISVDRIGEQVFDDNLSAQTMYREKLEESAINHQIELEDPLKYQKKYAAQKFILDSGIEVSIPMAAYQDKNQVELINNPDGKITLMIKGIDEIKNKFKA
ncbi:nucleoid-associated protein [Weissella kandleri]|uniref:nucleoid-associated protein n=1 Tax=Weissella kandleri TaxID=1616 RepID=UPI00387EB3D9